jgi:hypothetical protein
MTTNTTDMSIAGIEALDDLEALFDWNSFIWGADAGLGLLDGALAIAIIT